MKNVIIYARYSSDLQNDRSIEDQIAACKLSLGLDETVQNIFVDRAKSGAYLNTRSGIKALIESIQNSDYDLILTESLDRLSRSLEDIAHIYKLAQFHNVQIRTLLEKEITEMHICFNGAMASMQLQQIVERTRRGQIGNIMAHKSAGGLAYGYRVKPLNDTGKVEAGLREIVPEQAAVIRSIYSDYINGKPVTRIVKRLNLAEIPSPSGKKWSATTIAGHFDRKDGILQNPVYKGILVWGRCPEVKHPHTAQRQIRTAAPDQWVTNEAPELRIIDDETWGKAQLRRKTEYSRLGARGTQLKLAINCLCARCGALMIQNEPKYLICGNARRYHTCGHNARVRFSVLISHIMNHIQQNRDQLWTGWRDDLQNQKAQAQPELVRIGEEIATKQRENNNLVNALSGGLAASTTLTRRIMENEGKVRQLREQAVKMSSLPDMSPASRKAFMRKLARAKSEDQINQFLEDHIEAVTIDRDDGGEVELSGVKLK